MPVVIQMSKFADQAFAWFLDAHVRLSQIDLRCTYRYSYLGLSRSWAATSSSCRIGVRVTEFAFSGSLAEPTPLDASLVCSIRYAFYWLIRILY